MKHQTCLSPIYGLHWNLSFIEQLKVWVKTEQIVQNRFCSLTFALNKHKALPKGLIDLTWSGYCGLWSARRPRLGLRHMSTISEAVDKCYLFVSPFTRSRIMSLFHSAIEIEHGRCTRKSTGIVICIIKQAMLHQIHFTYSACFDRNHAN